MKIPKYLYHATLHEHNALSIITQGFNTNYTYFCSEPQHAVEFLHLRHRANRYLVIKVDASRLDVNNLQISTDHNPDAYSQGLESYVYDGVLDIEALGTMDIIEFNLS